MCGIAGFIDGRYSREQAAECIESMSQSIRHRGPDEQGIWIGDGVALGMRRLAIIDLVGGSQPIYNEDESILVVFNGEIYNFRELQDELRRRGHSFRTQSDTETIVHAYEEFGDECVDHLQGMFAFAIWDRRRQRLLAARDRFGKKPLHYYWDGQRLIFGSEIKSLLAAGIPREVNPIALDDYLTYRYVPTPNTLFQEVYKLPAASILTYEDGHISTKRYWELPFTPTCTDDEATAVERTRELLTEAVRKRLISEVPLGAFLSGGIDSSVVVGLMSSMMTQPVKTFSIGFEEDDYSELPYARKVAQHFGTDHQEFIVRPDFVSILPELIWAYDEPFADSSMVPTYYVSKLARNDVTVVLTGDGGDEIFGGYKRYAREVFINSLPASVRFLLGAAGTLLPRDMRGKRFLTSLRQDLASRYLQFTTLLSEESRFLLYTPEYFQKVWEHDPYERYIREFRVAKARTSQTEIRAVPTYLDHLSQMQYVDCCTYLTDDILVKVDRASMLNSLETRAPLLDQQLAEYVSSLPAQMRLHNGQLKYLLKRVAADILPAEIVDRPKQGFAVPLRHWLRGELMGYASDVLTSARARGRGIFNPDFVRHLLDSHASNMRVNSSETIWALLCLELWFQVYMDWPAGQPGLHTQRRDVAERKR